ncbi:unnamed protein product [Caenorhabditis angaria]|uniref:Fucosyltransferase n=1 Tax=Caenorhabditis angaria TaxID=860376 RepID=A0A9P1N009_9PELO|nr:unnamed protein product [Caenorhabditis angaria]
MRKNSWILLSIYSDFLSDPPCNKSIKIFEATGFFGDQIRNSAFLSHCSKEVQEYCGITRRKPDFEKADAVVFHARDYNHAKSRWLFENQNRNAKIPYIIWTMESPISEQNFPNSMNLTMSYDTASDIYFPYGHFRRKNQKTAENLEEIWKMKRKSAESGAEIAWMVSNCETVNRRMEIVQKLRKLGLKIDIFGKCGILPKQCSISEATSKCEFDLISPYKFYISIENSNCKDYITEKFWRNIKNRFVVPIVLGKQLYLDSGIPEKSFIALDDFENLEIFKNFIENLAENKTRYLEFHEWRNEFEIDDVLGEGSNDHGFCKLCRNLKSKKYSTNLKSYSNLVGSWHKLEDCDNKLGSQFLDGSANIFYFSNKLG